MDAILASTSTPLYKSPLSPVERAALRVAESAAISPAGGRDLTVAIVQELRAAGLLIVPATPGTDTEYQCPTCSVWSRWTRGRSIAEGDMADEFQCPSCGATTYLTTCNIRTSTAALRAENESLKAELEPYEVLNPQHCAKEVHVDWLVDSEHTHACPWCRIDKLTALLKQAQAEARTANTVGGDR
ncbi:hypothetical protein [Streptomyces sp. NPDC015125]|uniref:hypothetical protein n=1 Tax=Streptomyces sp. NPDC015125 TaxID=3364938 RepID=UPI0036F6B477